MKLRQSWTCKSCGEIWDRKTVPHGKGRNTGEIKKSMLKNKKNQAQTAKRGAKTSEEGDDGGKDS